MHAYALCRTLQCTAHRRAAVARQQHPSCYPGACTGEEAQPRGIPGEVSQLVRSACARTAPSRPVSSSPGQSPKRTQGHRRPGIGHETGGIPEALRTPLSPPDITTNSTPTFGSRPSKSTHSWVRRPLAPCSQPCEPNLAPNASSYSQRRLRPEHALPPTPRQATLATSSLARSARGRSRRRAAPSRCTL